jgi:hypothetical protein
MLKEIIQKTANHFGYRIDKLQTTDSIMDSEFGEIYLKCKDFTMTSKERMYGVYKAVEYIIKSGIKGDFVESGIWKGGSVMVMAYALLKFGETKRNIYLYDTYEGMSEPTKNDISVSGSSAARLYKKEEKMTYAPLEEVKRNLFSTGYPKDKLIFIKGKVEDTIPKRMPEKIALLRLDTDWYESTKHELLHLFPILTKKGVLLLDDYGHWLGSKKAVDEYFSNKPILLNRIDYTGRVGIKV